MKLHRVKLENFNGCSFLYLSLTPFFEHGNPSSAADSSNICTAFYTTFLQEKTAFEGFVPLGEKSS